MNTRQIKDCLIEGNLLFYGETKLERSFAVSKMRPLDQRTGFYLKKCVRKSEIVF